ncbi:gas vesicle synthesis family [Chlorella sorokiniana]|uniref:Gas vesicle synthesis family n=1 Tax=Chlorella sorokiniana TaxID=3076 RepID=A0A2P6TQK9_CHLSO|nr:gas vesicle synthesis family [Chlorella sorokiniana]|eukprot:PRW56321.1 gas vesicle synthesis family [Chlorella sorokiniana]
MAGGLESHTDGGDKRCQAMKGDGSQCSRKASEGSEFCFQHGGEKGGKTKAKGKK